MGHLLPVVEVVVGAAWCSGLLTRGAAVVSALLFVAFIIGIASAWARGIKIDCGCFGGGGVDAGRPSKYPWEIARDVGLLRAVGLPGLVAAHAARPRPPAVPTRRRHRRIADMSKTNRDESALSARRPPLDRAAAPRSERRRS